MAHSILSGKNAAITDDSGTPVPWSTLTDWRAIESHEEAITSNASNTSGMQVVTAGGIDLKLTASFEHTVPPAFPGETVGVLAWNGNSSGNQVLTADMIVDAITINFDRSTSQVIKGTIELSLDATSGAHSWASGSSVDTSNLGVLPSLATVIRTAALLTGMDSGDDVDGYQSSTFSLRCSNQATKLATGYPGRVAGPYAAGGSYTVHEADDTLIPNAGDIFSLAQFVTASTFYGFEYVRATSVERLHDIGTGAIIGYTCNWQYSGFNGTTKGRIVKPDTTAFFGATL